MKNELDRKLKKAKKAIKEVLDYYPSAKFEIQETETMFGSIVNHIYLVDKLTSGKTILQKHLLTID